MIKWGYKAMLNSFEFNLLYKEIKASVKREYGNVKYLNKEAFKQFLECKKLRDYTPMHNTDLYNKNSVCYCVLLQIMCHYYIPELYT